MCNFMHHDTIPIALIVNASLLEIDTYQHNTRKSIEWINIVIKDLRRGDVIVAVLLQVETDDQVTDFGIVSYGLPSPTTAHT